MPKVIELTVELEIQCVSCPGVWLCQDGRVSLTVYALGTSYQTCTLPPVFPLMFKDVFYFRKRFQETCSLNNICCLLKDETIYCELVQWCEDCQSDGCTILAQYLGAINDVLFPPNMCNNDGVDLLMRRAKEFPGILSPKIEVTTKMRIDEVLWNDPGSNQPSKFPKVKACSCTKPEPEGVRQKQVCHTPLYHRVRCSKRSPSGSRSGSRSGGSRSMCSLTAKEPEISISPEYRSPPLRSKTSDLSTSKRPRRSNCHQYQVYNVEVQTPGADNLWRGVVNCSGAETERDDDARSQSGADKIGNCDENTYQKLVLESQFIQPYNRFNDNNNLVEKPKICNLFKVTPCVCDICKRYHELFHTNRTCN